MQCRRTGPWRDPKDRAQVARRGPSCHLGRRAQTLVHRIRQRSRRALMRRREAVVVDGGAGIALALSRDPLHVQARERWDSLQESAVKLHASLPIVIETFTISRPLMQPASRSCSAHAFGLPSRSTTILTHVHVRDNRGRRGCGLFSVGLHAMRPLEPSTYTGTDTDSRDEDLQRLVRSGTENHRSRLISLAATSCYSAKRQAGQGTRLVWNP